MPAVLGIVLAAGKGTRMKSRLPKAAHALLGQPMVRWTVDLCRAAGAGRVLVVVGHGSEEVRAAAGEDVEFVEQPEQLGTGHAARLAAETLGDFDGTLLVLQADTLLIPPETLSAMLAAHRERGAAATILTALPEDAAHYGRVLRAEDGRVLGVVEQKDASAEVAALREMNVGAYCFEWTALLPALRQLTPNNRQGEYYLTDVPGVLAESGALVQAHRLEDPRLGMGINDRRELAAAAAILRARILDQWMDAGVTIVDPASTYVEPGVRIGEDTVIHPMTFLAGQTEIGPECDIGPMTRITDCRIGAGVLVHNSVLAQSEVGDGTRVGPFAHLRPDCRVGRNCKIGNFVELKKAELEDGVSAGHLAYIGDAFVGEKTNIGAGTITCNYDGKKKHVTGIGKRSFIGSNTTLIAPVTIGDGAFVAAASPVNQDVPPDALAVARVRQTNKEEWARKRREMQG